MSTLFRWRWIMMRAVSYSYSQQTEREEASRLINSNCTHSQCGKAHSAVAVAHRHPSIHLKNCEPHPSRCRFFCLGCVCFRRVLCVTSVGERERDNERFDCASIHCTTEALTVLGVAHRSGEKTAPYFECER
jgi:hypothetical protein